MKKIMGCLLIVFGISLLAFPTIKEKYYDYKQEKIMNEWEEAMKAVETYDINEEFIETDLSVNKISVQEQEKSDTKKENNDWIKTYIENNMEGVLKIKKIDFYQPILTGATEENLNISVATIENTGQMGRVGNYCIAGHRNRTYGRNFNRLDELEKGDIIEVSNRKETYIYEVKEKMIVKPEEIWVLKGNDKDHEITLITCDYSSKPTVRLIVKGIIKSL